MLNRKQNFGSASGHGDPYASVKSEVPEGYRAWNEIDELRYELRQAIGTVEFLHGCLTDSVFKYAYPEMTQRELERWRPLVERSPRCTAELFASRHPAGICPVHHRLMPTTDNGADEPPARGRTK